MVARVSWIDLAILTIATLTYCYNSVYTLMFLVNVSFTLEFELEIPKTLYFMQKLTFLFQIWHFRAS